MLAAQVEQGVQAFVTKLTICMARPPLLERSKRLIPVKMVSCPGIECSPDSVPCNPARPRGPLVELLLHRRHDWKRRRILVIPGDQGKAAADKVFKEPSYGDTVAGGMVKGYYQFVLARLLFFVL